MYNAAMTRLPQQLDDTNAERLWTYSQLYTLSKGFTFSPKCEQDFKALLSQVVSKIGADLGRAVASTTLLLDAMMRSAISKVLSENTLQGAKLALCPLWPFC